MLPAFLARTLDGVYYVTKLLSGNKTPSHLSLSGALFCYFNFRAAILTLPRICRKANYNTAALPEA